MKYPNKPTITQVKSIVYCEQKAFFEGHRVSPKGKQTEASKKVELRALEGVMSHAKMEAQGKIVMEQQRQTQPDKRCFIATCVYGFDADETNLIRNWRDKKLLTSSAGRAFAKIYYKISPIIVLILDSFPWLKGVMRWFLNMMIYRIKSKKDLL